jgi:small subunit ribosomal protein S5
MKAKKEELKKAGNEEPAEPKEEAGLETKAEAGLETKAEAEDVAVLSEAEKEIVFEEEPKAEKEGRGRIFEKETLWIPKTKLGNDVLAGKYKNLDEILEKGELILEPAIVDAMVPDIMQEIIYIGGSPGKGGGIRRTATKMTARMHKSGRRYKLSAMVVVGNGNGIVGVGMAISREHRAALEKAVKGAKLNVIRVSRGCGSWECGCGGAHSIPFKTSGKSGSVHVTLLPAPKGVGLVANDEAKKILKLAGIHDVWVKTLGMTSTRNNMIMAIFDALKNLNMGKGDL